MNFIQTKTIIIFLIVITSTVLYPQSTYFIKYKENIDKAEIEKKVTSQRFLPSNVLLKFSPAEFRVSSLANGIAKQDEVLGRIIKVNFKNAVDESTILNLKDADPNIEYIQKSNIYRLNYLPNDSLISQQWALQKIKAFEAWQITQGSDSILVSIIDTGIDYLHPDLSNRIFTNPGETGIDANGQDKRFNNYDDDENGFIDDYMGWDFVDRVGFPFDTTSGDYHSWDNNPMDEHSGSHGTAVAGIIGAEANNVVGISGIAPNIKLVNVRSFDAGGFGEEDDAAAAILYSVLIGAKVINMSWGDFKFSYVLRDVIRYAYSQNVVLIGSSGNYPPSPTPNTLHYPSGFPEVISVGNSTAMDTRAMTSVYGSTLDLVAPGSNILTTSRNNTYTSGPIGFNGTSAAAPHVSAAAALILSVGNFSNEEVKQILKSTSDDIQKQGWDEQTGAGRLNIFRALTILAPSVVKFNSPALDFATNEDHLFVNATILSPYFVSYSLELGSGYNPSSWTSLIANGLNQFTSEDIYNLELNSLADSVYTLKLIVNQNNGRTLEERTHFHIMRTPPKVVEVGLGALYYGEQSTIAGEFLTNQPSVMRLYYRKAGESIFNFITLDGFNTNSQFVNNHHYGFIPKNLVTPQTQYEIYFEAENLAGLKTTVVDSSRNNGFFLISTEERPQPENYQSLNLSLPPGNLFHNPTNFLSDNYDEVLFQIFYPSSVSYFGLYKYSADKDNLVKIDSLEGKFPRGIAKFNNDNKKYFVSYKAPDIIIDEVIPSDKLILQERYKSPNLYNTSLIEDLNGDGIHEIVQQKDQKSYKIWTVKPDLSVEQGVEFYKSYKDSDSSFSLNNYINENILVTDSDNYGKKDIWFVDTDGDLIQYHVNDLNNIVKGNDSLKVSGVTILNNYIFSAGDYNGDGRKDFAILYNTNSIAPTFLLLIVTFENNHPRVITQKVFLDQSSEYSGGLSFNDLYQSLRFVDVDADNKDELVVNMFPYIYIFKYSEGNDRIILFEEGINNFRIFAGDLNQNGIKEIALRYKEKIGFIEFLNSNRTLLPSNVTGYSVISSKIKLTWYSSAQKFFIYKGLSSNNLELIDSVDQREYIDSNVSESIRYYYAVRAFDAGKPEPLSNLSKIIEVYSHTPARPSNIISKSNYSVIVEFTEKMKNVIDNLQSFELLNIGFPHSVSPYNQYAYLLSFKNSIPAGSNRLVIKDIKDLYGSSVMTDTIEFFASPVTEIEGFYVSSFEIINQHRIKVIFNHAVDVSSATTRENYSFEPYNSIESIEIDETNNKGIFINLDGSRPVGAVGIEYRLHIQNVKSSIGTLINSTAGSYVVLTSFAEDLSKVFVYPNPYRPGTGDQKIVFAGLPKKAAITIYSLNGKLIRSIEENNGDGGINFDLIDQNGEQMGTGVYFFRIVRLDDSGNEIEEKLGKFAIVR